MAVTQVFSAANLAIQATPPSYHLPSDAGVAIPAGKTGWQLAVDLGGAIPAGLACKVAVEYQRNQWTDANGTLHPAGEWLPDVSVSWITGSYTPRSTGVPTTIHNLASSIGAIAEGGGMVEPYPTHARIRVDQAGNWTLPSVTLTLS